ncbi:dynamin family protein [Biformimicrobium ophioploci]|uniref:Dynamin-like GTPase family protein n=1 Tax=Biformimicrobium ophioploci TaxID=3036711 RepID=A0ABQ6LV04_9GAMM|nr:dynamin family protein [Microbulbifer sp. NKW57]GMG85931.1 dynamin-like GTPase family protein [Microbulbifer sp. NKW57]
MEEAVLRQHIAEYDQWKKSLGEQFRDFHNWLEQHFPNSSGARQMVRQAQRLLEEDQFTVALVGEFSRGKTELINALLSHTYGQRLLPSRPGRTTMCPTEIYSDGSDSACVRLLPIETLATNTSLESFRRIPQKWVSVDFDPSDAEATRNALLKVAATKSVLPDEAARYGFDRRHLDRNGNLVEVPAWRYALINMPHPLLAQGLRIIDTPGLNALGNEPELTLSTLPGAQAVAFLLSADAGVSGTDLNMWETHLVPLMQNRGTSIFALLNKIDSLWDDPDEDAEALMRRMRAEVSHLLALQPNHIVGVSAKQALLARQQRDQALLQRSRFGEFEALLVERLQAHRHKVANHRILHQTMTLMADTRDLLKRRINSSEHSLRSLQKSAASSNQQNELEQLQVTVRGQHKRCQQELLGLKASQRSLQRQRAALVAPVAQGQLRRLIEDTRSALAERWSPLGMARAIDGFMEAVDGQMLNLEREVDQANRLLDGIYSRAGIGSAESKQQYLDISHCRQALQGLHQQATHLRRSPQLLLVRRSRLTERFLETVANEVCSLYERLHEQVDNWIDLALEPLRQHVQYQKHLLDRYIQKLTEIKQKSATRRGDLRVLESELRRNSEALQVLETLMRQSAASAPQPREAPLANNVTPLKGTRTPA